MTTKDALGKAAVLVVLFWPWMVMLVDLACYVSVLAQCTWMAGYSWDERVPSALGWTIAAAVIFVFLAWLESV